MRILIVEDEADYRDALRDQLNLSGFACDTVGSIKSYLAWVNSQRCDVLLLDRNLPDGDGLSIVRNHRKLMESKIIIVSALVSPQHRIEAYAHDIDKYINKPVICEELISILKSLQRRKMNNNIACWRIDTVGLRLFDQHNQVSQLTFREAQILSLFVGKSGEPVTRKAIVEALGEDYMMHDPKKIEVILRRMRNKINQQHGTYPISTIYGVGLVANCDIVPL